MPASSGDNVACMENFCHCGTLPPSSQIAPGNARGQSPPMNAAPPLSRREAALLESVFEAHPEVTEATLFGSRAKGNHSAHSDVDISVRGRVTHLQAAEIAAELDDLPLPYHFDVVVFDMIEAPALREEIRQSGIRLYPEGLTRFDPPD